MYVDFGNLLICYLLGREEQALIQLDLRLFKTILVIS